MKKIGCLFTWIIAFICIAGLYAVNIADEDRLRTPDYYEAKVRSLFKNERWEEGKPLLDEGLEKYPDVTGLNELNGQYYLQKKNYDDARYFLVRAVRDNPDNVRAKQLLIRVEDETGNYSSAICYVNELLEINPYWQGLWRKKIGLYRAQGNDVEADRLLKRLHQIYPNDSVVQRDYAYSLEEKYLRQKKGSDKEAAIASLRELINEVPDNETYYLDLTNLLLQQGNTVEALEVAGRGVSRIPGSTSLIVKKAGILAEEARYQEAMAFVKQRMRYNHSGRLAQLYNGLLAEAANAARMNDPYTLYGQMYERSKSDEALDYMLSASITRGYDEDALFYLAEAKRKKGELPSLLYKEYTVYRRMGNLSKAYGLLSQINEMEPFNYDVADELSMLSVAQADKLMEREAYAEALPYLKTAVDKAKEAEVKAAAWNKAYACYYAMRRFNEADIALDSLHASYPESHDYLVRKADVYDKRGWTKDALDMLETALQDTTQLEMRAAYVSAYEEIAVPYIKKLIEEGATRKAYDESVRLVGVNPSSELGLQYVINMSSELERYDDYDLYADMALSIYPENTAFLLKKAVTYNRNREYQRAIDLLRPELDEYPGNESLVGAFSENSEFMALQLLKERRADSAIAVVDTALVFDKTNQSLLLAKGTAYEALRQYDSAYVYQKKYKPGIGEVRSHERHLEGLLSRSYKNEVSLEYLQGRYGEEDVLTSVATASYTRKMKSDLLTGRLNYAGRDGSAAGEDPEDQTPGGVGVQLQAEWEHKFSAKWNGTASLAWGSRYFPKLMGSLMAAYTFKNDVSLDVHASYRRINTYRKAFRWDEGVYNEATENYGLWTFDRWDENRRNLFSLGIGASKTWEKVYLGGKVDGFLLSSNLYANASAQLKFFPLEDGRTNVTVTGSVGTAPEANMIDNAMPGSFDKLNTSVGLGGAYMLNKHISVGLMGTWNTFYSQMNRREGGLNGFTDHIDTRYRNLYNVHLQLHIHF